MSVLLHLGESTIFGNLGIQCCQPSLEVSDEFYISSSGVSFSSSVQVSSRTSHRSIQTYSCAMMDGCFVMLPIVLYTS